MTTGHSRPFALWIFKSVTASAAARGGLAKLTSCLSSFSSRQTLKALCVSASKTPDEGDERGVVGEPPVAPPRGWR